MTSSLEREGYVSNFVFSVGQMLENVSFRNYALCNMSSERLN